MVHTERPSSSELFQFVMNTPTKSRCPCCCSNIAATDESIPPDMATATVVDLDRTQRRRACRSAVTAAPTLRNIVDDLVSEDTGEGERARARPRIFAGRVFLEGLE
jgi:hypothetical protein